MAISITAQRNIMTNEAVANLEQIFRDAGIEFFRTGANLNTLTYQVGEINGKEVYGSIKFTLHKDGYDLDEAIEEYEMLLEERQKAAEEKAEKKAKAEKEKERKIRKASEKKELEAISKERRLRAIEERKERLQKYTEETARQVEVNSTEETV